MGNDLSTARYITVGSWVINFGTQIYGMLSTPNMKEIADANHYAFSPNPWFIAAFFSGQTVLQLYWIRQMFLRNQGYKQLHTAPASGASAVEADKELDEQAAVRSAVEYAPIYSIGNLCIAGWLFFWLRENFVASQILVTVNTAIQLLGVARLPPLTTSSPSLLRTTHLVAKTFAGIGILDFIDNGGVVMQYLAPPSALLQALTYISFPIVAASSSPLFGSFLVYDLVAVFVGQRNAGSAAAGWGNSVGLTALVTAGIVAWKAFTSQGRV